MSTLLKWSLQWSLAYWDNFYQQELDLPPSLFAEYCLPQIDKRGTLLELGCGNGRDAKFFAAHDVEVIACDQSERALAGIQGTTNIQVLLADFSNLAGMPIAKVSTIYSRFSLHSITSQQYYQTLQWCKQALVAGGKMFIEVRSVFDALYGKGDKIERDTFATDHLRRFFRKEELNCDLTSLGFSIETSCMGTGFAPYKDEDPMIIRVVAIAR